MKIVHVGSRGRVWVVGLGVGVLALSAVGGTVALRGSPAGVDAGAGQAGVGVSPPVSSPSAVPAVSTQLPRQPAAGGPGPSGAAPRSSARGSGSGESLSGRRGLLLWPFSSAGQVTDWEASYRTGGHQPWHASPCVTASFFVRYALGFDEVSRVAGCWISRDQAWVTLGYDGQDGVDATGATIHLVRVGSHPGAWVVVGSRDRATLSIPTPRYGAEVGRTVHLAGNVQGLGEDVLTVRILNRAGRTIAQAPGRMVGLGGSWGTDIHVPSTADPVLIAVASTDSGRGPLADLAITAIVLDE